MESVISGLLEEFEAGKMTRRQLIQSLAVAALTPAAVVEAELNSRGLNPRPDMVGDNFKSFHVLDPDGWDLQISNETRQG